MGAELLEARSRVTELELGQSADRQVLQTSTANLANAGIMCSHCLSGFWLMGHAGERMTELVERMKQQKEDMHVTLSASAETQAQLAATEDRCSPIRKAN